MAKKYYSPQSHESEFYEVDNIDHHLTLENIIVLLNSPTPSENSYFCSILQSPWLARGPTTGASRGHARYSSTRMFLANSGAVAQEKSKTRKQESPAHIYQSEIEGKAVLK